MTKAEIINRLIILGCDADGLRNKKKPELEDILNDHEWENQPVAGNVELVITSKRSDRYWLEDGSHIMFKDIPKWIKTGQLTPFPKAKDVAVFFNGKFSSFECREWGPAFAR